MSAGHTPGPWRFELAIGPHGQKCYHTIKCNEYDYVASTWGKPHEANARLIAAAPELLAALKELLESYERQMHSEYDFPGSPWSAERDNDTEALNAMKAIAKAEGK